MASAGHRLGTVVGAQIALQVSVQGTWQMPRHKRLSRRIRVHQVSGAIHQQQRRTSLMQRLQLGAGDQGGEHEREVSNLHDCGRSVS